MASRPIIWVMTSPCMLIYMGMIQGALRLWIYINRGAPRRFIKEVFLYKGSSLWNKLPPWVKESTSLNDFKHNYRLLNGWMHSEFRVPFICTSILYHFLMLSFYQFCLQLDRYNHIHRELISILSWYWCFYIWFVFMNVYICVLYIYVFYFVTGHHGRTV